MNLEFDVAIVGASLSGASLAGQLGARGVRVALIDRDSFPRRKACGEGVSDLAILALHRLGFTKEDLEVLSGQPFSAYRLDCGKWSLCFASGRNRSSKGIGVQRIYFDKMLLDRASSFPSVEVLTESQVTGFDVGNKSVTVTLKSGRQLTSRYLVLADGANSMSATKLGIPKVRNRHTHWGISFALEGEYEKRTDEVLVLLKEGFEIYCTPVSDTVLNVAILTEKDSVVRLQDTLLRNQLLQEAAEKSFFNGEAMGIPLQVGPIGTRRCYVHDSILLVGDAAESFDPVSGMGITHGLLTAELASQVLCSVLKEGKDEKEAFNDYARKCKKMSRPLRGFTRLTGSLLRASFRKVLIPLLSGSGVPYLVRRSLSEGTPTLFFALLRIVGL